MSELWQDDNELQRCWNVLRQSLPAGGHAVYGHYNFDSIGRPIERVLRVHLHPDLGDIDLPASVGPFRVERAAWGG